MTKGAHCLRRQGRGRYAIATPKADLMKSVNGFDWVNDVELGGTEFNKLSDTDKVNSLTDLGLDSTHWKENLVKAQNIQKEFNAQVEVLKNQMARSGRGSKSGGGGGLPVLGVLSLAAIAGGGVGLTARLLKSFGVLGGLLSMFGKKKARQATPDELEAESKYLSSDRSVLEEFKKLI